MKLGDITIADCIKAGWSAEDVEKLTKLLGSDTDNTQTDTENTQTDNEPTYDDKIIEELENVKAELLKTKQSLEQAQKLNRSKDVSNINQKSDEDILSDFFKSF